MALPTLGQICTILEGETFEIKNFDLGHPVLNYANQSWSMGPNKWLAAEIYFNRLKLSVLKLLKGFLIKLLMTSISLHSKGLDE